MNDARILRIRGMVQGVGYRASLQAVAEQLGIVGWVRNRRDGSVEAMVQGSADRLIEIERWCWKGPRSASVRDIERIEAAPEPEMGGFRVRPTAE